MSCLSKIAQEITNTCINVPAAGLEVKGWLMDRSDCTFTPDPGNAALITLIELEAPAVAYPITAVKKENNAGFDVTVADNLPDLFNHYLSAQPYERDSDAVKNIDEMDDIVAVLELKGPKTEGCFVILGLETGLHKSSASGRFNDNHGIPTYEFATREGEGEKYSRYIFWAATYDATLAILEGLEPA